MYHKRRRDMRTTVDMDAAYANHPAYANDRPLRGATCVERLRQRVRSSSPKRTSEKWNTELAPDFGPVPEE